MKRSVTEIEAMALKAARGAGVPLGHAEDFARAVAMLAMIKPQALGEVPGALQGDLVLKAPLAIDALRCGAKAVPLPDHVLVAGYLARAAADFDMPFEYVSGVARRGGAMPAPRLGPVDVPDMVWGALDKLAQKTYVPATAASRAGAGAGSIDND